MKLLHKIFKRNFLNKIFEWTISYKNESIIPKPSRSFGGNIYVKVDLSSYATKIDLKNVAHFDTSSFALKQI